MGDSGSSIGLYWAYDSLLSELANIIKSLPCLLFDAYSWICVLVSGCVDMRYSPIQSGLDEFVYSNIRVCKYTMGH